LQSVGEAIHDRTEKFYDSVNYFGGEEAEQLARGATEAYLDMGFVAGAKLSFDQLMKSPIKTYQTGGRIVLDGNSLEGWDKAIKHYDIIRKDPNDIASIVKNTGFKDFHVSRIKDHVFSKDHILNDGSIGKFHPDPEIVNAWDRLKTGDFIKTDLQLLNHEIFESKFEGIFKVSADDAHKATLKSGRTWDIGE